MTLMSHYAMERVMLAKELIEFYKKQNRPVQLNLGCYDKLLPNYINVDIRSDTKCDIVDNIVRLDTIPDNSCDLIEAHHVFEHLNYTEGITALKNWYAKLKTGGKIRLSVPDIEMACRLYIWEQDIKLIRSMLSGSQKHSADFHLSHYDEKSLTELLENIGFQNIERWTPCYTYPHNYIDSYADARYPHMMKEYQMGNGQYLDLGGKLLSLNLEGIKVA